MSEGDTFWISLGEKFFGLLVLIIGGMLLYYTITSTVQLGPFPGLFAFLGVFVVAIGVVLLLVRPPE
jgi:hypothetical protein